MHYLGHIISSEGTGFIKDKIENIQNLGRPATVKEIKHFLGLMGYYITLFYLSLIYYDL